MASVLLTRRRLSIDMLSNLLCVSLEGFLHRGIFDVEWEDMVLLEELPHLTRSGLSGSLLACAYCTSSPRFVLKLFVLKQATSSPTQLSLE